MRLRSQLERVARRDLALATSALHGIDQQLLAAARGRREFAEAAALGGATGQLARALENGLLRHEWRLLGLQRKGVAALEAARREYVAKARDLGTLEKLEERRRQDWLGEAQRLEQAELDELARLGRDNVSRGEAGAGEAR
ncbi:MAG: hypothetical protein KDC98_01395 [Planctomycetes bacterium]|nr:hypothetical protein [Planctomycetota bacterium]